MESLTHLRCPKCKQQLLRSTIPALVAAVEIQAKRVGVDVECHHCKHHFVYREDDEESDSQS